MATSRTGTATWKRVRSQALKQAQDNGQTYCPECGTWLDWAYSKRPNSPEADHIIPHSQGGKDALENTRIICRNCNQSLGGKLKPASRQPVTPARLATHTNW